MSPDESEVPTLIDDPLWYLPRTRVAEIAGCDVIYPAPSPEAALYVVLSGRVRVDCVRENGRRTLLRIVGPEQLFGKCLPVNYPDHESATAMTKVRLMRWSANEVEQKMAQNSGLAMSLCAHFARLNALAANRVSALGALATGPRTVMGLLDLAEMSGERMADGTMLMEGMAHKTIAEYVGTSREIVTSEMNRLRQDGYVAYTRSYLVVHDDALRAWLRQTYPHLRPLMRPAGPAAAV